MSRNVLLDTGPIVSMLVAREETHLACVEEAKRHSGQLVTCWPVITEAASMLKDYPIGIDAMFRMLNSGTITLAPLDNHDAESIGSIMATYRSIRCQLADASLVFLADREQIDTVFTLDRRDFGVYRTRTGRALKIIPPAT